MKRLRMVMRGRVQGVGFRPHLYRLALERGLRGTISNSDAGVVTELEGEGAVLAELLRLLPGHLPANAELDALEHSWLEPGGATKLEILASSDSGGRGARIPSDLATCASCQAELADPGDRRHRYAFTNCTDCGPRFSIAAAIPYDRHQTSMRGFPLCAACGAEYTDPLDRRYHAEPIACPVCGPQLRLVDSAGRLLAKDALVGAAALLQAGKVVAVKGLGGFHLACDASSEAAVGELRRRKGRELKPLAVMVRDLATARRLAQLGPAEEALLGGTRAPIVLLPKVTGTGAGAGELAPSVAPANPYVGLMLPYTPLHHLLLAELPALVMTSGNLSEEPIAICNEEARARLASLADAFLEHDREILVACDDSVLAPSSAGPILLRRSRGYVPDPLRLQLDCGNVLAVGGQLKNTFCLTQGQDAYLGPHVGDLDNLESYEHFQRALAHMKRLLRLEPEAVVHDLHPDYATTRLAEALGLPATAVQHHHAHLAAVALDRGLTPPLLGLALDGTGYGSDGTIWGGELLLLGAQGSFERLGHLRPFSLPGGEACIKAPRRTALALLLEQLGPQAAAQAAPWLEIADAEADAVARLLQTGVATARTTSCGRLFDAVAALLGLGRRVTYEGQPAMELEFCAGTGTVDEGHPFAVANGEGLVLDPAPALAAILQERAQGRPVAEIAARFHLGLAEGLARLCRRAAEPRGLHQVVLGGGCFQNRHLVRLLGERLASLGLSAYLPRRVPPNDGGLALGQVAVYTMIKE